MTYRALARKWRPQCFSTFVGQSHAVTALTNAINHQRLHHAYLFSGTRGIGKTTIARIFAKSLNCQQGIQAPPCLKCKHCLGIAEGQFIDLIEVDAASKTKVEDTRELLENTQFVPHTGRYKVFLIDEVHMLSGHSFNALLKTLEEPPEHVKFLLATTDPQKLPITVLSRCLHFHLKPLDQTMIVDHLHYILTEENIQFEPSALTLIAKAAQGSMRDALSCTDQLIALTNSHITLKKTEELLGMADMHLIEQVLINILDGDAGGLIQSTNDLAKQGTNPLQVLPQLLEKLHQFARHLIAPNQVKPPIEMAKDSFWQTLSPQDQQEAIQLFYQIALLGDRDIGLAPTPQIGLEMTLLRMLSFQPQAVAPLLTPANIGHATPANNTTPSTPQANGQTTQDQGQLNTKAALANRNATPSTPQANGQTTQDQHQLNTKAALANRNATPQNQSSPDAHSTNSKQSQEIAATMTPTDSKQSKEITAASWPTIALSLNVQGMTKAIINHCAFESLTDQHLTLILEKSKKAMLNHSHVQRVTQALIEQGHQISVEILTTEEHLHNRPTAQKHQQLKQVDQQKNLTDNLQNDPKLQNIVQNLEGEIVDVKGFAETIPE